MVVSGGVVADGGDVEQVEVSRSPVQLGGADVGLARHDEREFGGRLGDRELHVVEAGD